MLVKVGLPNMPKNSFLDALQSRAIASVVEDTIEVSIGWDSFVIGMITQRRIVIIAVPRSLTST